MKNSRNQGTNAIANSSQHPIVSGQTDDLSASASAEMAMSKSWWKERVFYQIYTKSFLDTNADGIGDLAGIIAKLDYLQNLGVGGIWLSPLTPSGGKDNGYDVTNYTEIDPVYGDWATFDQLIDQAHQRDIKVIIDWVANHTSNQHDWFKRSCAGDPEYSDFYVWNQGTRSKGQGASQEQGSRSREQVAKVGASRDTSVSALNPKSSKKAPTEWLAAFGEPAWTYNNQREQYYLGLFSPFQPDLNWHNPQVHQTIYQAMQIWTKHGIDGFRLDAISYLDKPQTYQGLEQVQQFSDLRDQIANRPLVHQYLKEMRAAVDPEHQLFWLGETAGVTPKQVVSYTDPDARELDACFQFEHMNIDGGETFKWTKQSIPATELIKVLDRWQTELTPAGWNALFFDNHDQPRMLSRLSPNPQFNPYIAKLLAVILLFQRGSPFIFQGDELGMTNAVFSDFSQFRDLESQHAIEYLRQHQSLSDAQILQILNLKSRDTSRVPLIWNSNANGGFTEGIPWMQSAGTGVTPAEEQMHDPNSVFSFYQHINKLRQSELASYGDYQRIPQASTNLYSFTRTLGNQQLLAVNNLDKIGRHFSFPTPEQSWKLVVDNYQESNTATTPTHPNVRLDPSTPTELKPFETRIYLNSAAQTAIEMKGD